MSAEPSEPARLETAMTELCAERGYRHVTLPLLLERVGVGEGAFHRHFDDLEDCFCAAVQAGTYALLARVGRVFGAQEGWRNQLRAVAYEMLHFLQENPERAHLMVVESPTAGEPARAIREDGMAALTELIDRGRAELEDPDSVSRATAEVTAGAIYNRIHVAIEQGDLGAEMVPELMHTAVQPYLGTEAALQELSISPPG